jgi:hypothetical protein
MPEHDDLSPFTQGFTEGTHVNPIPASEVRRRGDRMRRRNTALAAVGGVVAAAVFIGTPVALMNGNDDDRGPQPAPNPTVTDGAEPDWLTEMPDGFPVTEGMVSGAGEATEGDLDAFPLCDSAYPRPQGSAHAETWFYSGDGESSTQRTFQLWPDDAAARESVETMVEAVQACPTQPTLGGEAVVESRLVDYATDGDRSVTFAQQVREDDGLVSGLFTVQVTVVGNAVLVNSNYGSAGGDEAIGIAAGILEERSATTRGAMCVFAADPCSTTEVTPDAENSAAPPVEETIPAIPEDFPLARGLTDGGDSTVEGPGPDVEGAPVSDLCGSEVFVPSAMVQRLATVERGIEYRQSRELFTFPTADEASESVTQVREAVTACPRLEGDFYGYTTRVLAGVDGYDSFTWGYFADEGLDGGVFQVTRVGAAVLVVFAAGESSESSLQPTADNLSPVTLDLAPELCLWTEDGC